MAHAARLAAEARSDLVTTVGRMIADGLDLDDCHYDPQPGPPAFHPVLGPDGSLTWGQHTVDVPRDGLPTMDVIELPTGPGRILLTASSHVRRPDHEQLLVAVTLVEQVGAVSPVRP